MNFWSKHKYCEACSLSEFTKKFKKWNLVNNEFIKKNINLSDIHFLDTSVLILENNHIFIYAIESLEFLKKYFNLNFKKGFQKEEETKIKIYQSFLFFIRDTQIKTHTYFLSIFANKKKFKEKKKVAIFIDLVFQICELFDTWKNPNPLFYTIEIKNKINDVLQKIKKQEPFNLKTRRWWKKIKNFFISYPTHILVITTFVINLATTLIAVFVLR